MKARFSIFELRSPAGSELPTSNQRRMPLRRSTLVSSTAIIMLLLLSTASAHATPRLADLFGIGAPIETAARQPRIYEGVAGSLLIEGTQHSLFVEVERTTEPSGTVARYSVERRARCYSEGGLFLCPVLWKERGSLQQDQFILDIGLERASLDILVRGSRMSITWDGSGDLRVSPGSGTGYLLLQQREAVASGRWKRSSLKSPASAGQGLMYRRFE